VLEQLTKLAQALSQTKGQNPSQTDILKDVKR